MSQVARDLIKNSKGFYIKTYRKISSVLFFSTAINLIFIVMIAYVYLTIPERDFYATNGATPPVELTFLDEPNYTSTPLLASDPDNRDDNKVIPQ